MTKGPGRFRVRRVDNKTVVDESKEYFEGTSCGAKAWPSDARKQRYRPAAALWWSPP
eukprot:m.215786 g.215786  ORF g.215786 m.215786 type:complete len:57 (+) comp22206_c6_seq4:427-597(+)